MANEIDGVLTLTFDGGAVDDDDVSVTAGLILNIADIFCCGFLVCFCFAARSSETVSLPSHLAFFNRPDFTSTASLQPPAEGSERETVGSVDAVVTGGGGPMTAPASWLPPEPPAPLSDDCFPNNTNDCFAKRDEFCCCCLCKICCS